MVLSETMTSKAQTRPLSLQVDGAQLFPGVLDRRILADLISSLAGQPAGQAGVRLFGLDALRPLLAPGGVIGSIVAGLMAGAPRPVRAILFDKTERANWSLGWHQDRVVAVKQRVEAEGFGPWTRKHGALHVAPPFDVIERMVTLRVHLDPVPATNAPLLIAPGSHKLGRISEPDVRAVVQRCGAVACLAEPGDIWAYATPILHASERAAEPRHRRVLQVDYATGDLPEGLEWLGV